MANLLKRDSLHPYFERGSDVVWDQFTNATIEVIDMNLEDGAPGYNWFTNEESAPSTAIIYRGVAHMQVFRFTLTMDAPVGSVDQVRSARFTINPLLLSPEIDIRKGAQIRVIECATNPSLETYHYIVNSGLNSSHNFRRTIECDVDMGRVLPREPAAGGAGFGQGGFGRGGFGG